MHAALLIAIFVTACGGGGDGSSATPSSPPNRETGPGTTPPGATPPGTIPVTGVPVLKAVVVRPSQLDIPPEFAGQVTAVAQFDDDSTQDVTEQASWRSGDQALATVSDRSGSKGQVTGVAGGNVTITAQYAGFAGTVAVKVASTRLIGSEGLVFPAPNGLMTLPSVAIDGLGHAHAAWGYQASGEVYYGGRDGTDWTDRVQGNKNQTPADFAFGLRMLTNASGARLILWNGFSGLYAVYAAPGQSLGAVQTVLPDLGSLSFTGTFGARLTAAGDAVLIWGGLNTTFVSRYSAATGLWAPRVDLGLASTSVNGAKPAFNANGDAIVAWTTVNSTTGDLTLRAGILLNDGSGTGLRDVRDLVTAQQLAIPYVEAAINENRDAVLLWAGFGATPSVAQYSSAVGWHTNRALPLGEALGVFEPRVAMNPSNNIFVAWADHLGQRPYASTFTPLDGWQTAQALSTAFGLGSSTVNALAIADNGNAICIFVDAESFAPKQFKYRRFVVGQGWGAMSVLPDPGLVGEPNQTLFAAYNGSGQGVMAWQEAGAIPASDGGSINVGFNFMELAPGINP
ncbi:MAG: Ig-like domain-containing protein [Burkholderiales bacterium]